MKSVFSSTLLLTILLGIGLAFFLRAASKDRTTVVEVTSPLPPLEVLKGISCWLEERGWKRDGGDADQRLLRFNGDVAASYPLTIFLSLLGGLGSGCLGLVLYQLFPWLEWWPLLLSVIGGPLAGYIYRLRAARIESVELKLIDSVDEVGSTLRLRAHRDELIALQIELAKKLELSSENSLMSSPI